MINKTILYVLAIIGATLVLSWYFSDIFFYVVFSMVISTILRPLVTIISQTTFLSAHIPRPIAILFAFTMMLSVISLFIIIFIPLISVQVDVLSKVKFDDLYSTAAKPIEYFEELIISNQFTTQQPGFIVESLRQTFIQTLKNIDFQKVVNDLISFTGSFFIGTLAISFITFFLLLENGILRRKVIAIIPNKYFEVFIAAIFKIESLLSNYLIGLLFQMVSIFSLASVGLTILGIPYALTIGLFAAFANLIPYAGPILGATFGILVSLSTDPSLGLSQESVVVVSKVLAVFAVVQATDNIVLQPLIFSKSVKAHPLEIFVVIFAGATIAGITGMISAIPVYTIFRVTAIEMNTGFKRYKIFKI
jgi:predicted PurR-regulated permease PerM